ncbi:hypothetical protein GEMRC1_002537 [Eukaryota sp. GEM-RC1]
MTISSSTDLHCKVPSASKPVNKFSELSRSAKPFNPKASKLDTNVNSQSSDTVSKGNNTNDSLSTHDCSPRSTSPVVDKSTSLSSDLSSSTSQVQGTSCIDDTPSISVVLQQSLMMKII